MPEEILALGQFYEVAIEFAVEYGLQIIGAIIILIIGFIVARWLSRMVMGFCEKKGLDITLTRFLGSVVKIIVLCFVLIIALGKFGISMAPFIAALGAIAFGASFALQGPLSNYSAGLIIILTRPFVVGNTIRLEGVNGVVEEIKLAATILTNEDGEQITIPNKMIVGDIIINSFENKVVEAVVGISYDDDPEQAIAVIREALEQNPNVVPEPEPQIGIQEFGDSSVNIGMRYWVPTRQYFQTLYETNLAVYKALNRTGISIPFPQRVVHAVSEKEKAA